ncbi:unnamed protein product [Ectocarpus sp. 12 AP-2014]
MGGAMRNSDAIALSRGLSHVLGQSFPSHAHPVCNTLAPETASSSVERFYATAGERLVGRRENEGSQRLPGQHLQHNLDKIGRLRCFLCSLSLPLSCWLSR